MGRNHPGQSMKHNCYRMYGLKVSPGMSQEQSWTENLMASDMTEHPYLLLKARQLG